jgi:hypothetical protein
MSEYENEGGMHDLTLGNVCTVKNGKFAGKTVLVIKAGIQTKFGIKAITVEYKGEHNTGEEKIWVAPEQLTYNGADDTDTANAIKEADYQEWRAKKNAGVPDIKPAFNKKTYSAKKEQAEDDVPF